MRQGRENWEKFLLSQNTINSTCLSRLVMNQHILNIDKNVIQGAVKHTLSTCKNPRNWTFIPPLCLTPVSGSDKYTATKCNKYQSLSTWEVNINHKLICMHTKSYIKRMLFLFCFTLSECHIYSCTCNLNLSPLCIQPVHCGRQAVRDKMWPRSPRSQDLHAWKWTELASPPWFWNPSSFCVGIYHLPYINY